jgi:hypothetical protein
LKIENTVFDCILWESIALSIQASVAPQVSCAQRRKPAVGLLKPKTIAIRNSNFEKKL